MTTISTPDPLNMVREALCVAQAGLGAIRPGREGIMASRALGRLIEDIDRQRPLGPDGQHGDRHTASCGCEDGELRLVTNHEDPLFSPGDLITIQDKLAGWARRYRVLEPLDSGVRVRMEPVSPGEVDPTTIPQPRRWGTVIRGQYRGERVYWDAGLHARGENAWTNAAHTRRFSADQVRGDREDKS